MLNPYATILRCGVTSIPTALSSLPSSSSPLPKWKKRAVDTCQTIVALGETEERERHREMGKEGGLGEGRERGFKEIWKGEGGGDKGGRYYVCLNHHKGSVYHPLDYRPEAAGMWVMSEIVHHVEKHTKEFLPTWFNGEYFQSSQGLVYTKPGTKDESWHTLAPSLFRGCDDSVYFPTYFPIPMFSLTVFVPLFGAPSIEYAIASQHLSGNLNESPTTTTNDNHINITNTTPETIISCSGGLETSEGEEGDLIIVDDRVMRRGVGWEGEGGEGRVMGWVRYSRPWFKSGGGGRSVFESVNFSV